MAPELAKNPGATVPWQRLAVKALRRALATKSERRDKEATVEHERALGAPWEVAVAFQVRRKILGFRRV